MGPGEPPAEETGLHRREAARRGACTRRGDVGVRGPVGASLTARLRQGAVLGLVLLLNVIKSSVIDNKVELIEILLNQSW